MQLTPIEQERLEYLESIEQPLKEIKAGNGGDFGVEQLIELIALRYKRNHL